MKMRFWTIRERIFVDRPIIILIRAYHYHYTTIGILPTACDKFHNVFSPCNGKMIDSLSICFCHRLQSFATADFSYNPFLQEPLPDRNCS